VLSFVTLEASSSPVTFSGNLEKMKKTAINAALEATTI
jgi:hypothetical protein